MPLSDVLVDGLVQTITVWRHHETGKPYFSAFLRCGGDSGYGDTVEDAIVDARAKNAEWLNADWIKPFEDAA